MNWRHYLFMLLPGVIALGLWEIAVHDDLRGRFLFGSPGLVWSIAAEELATGAIWRDVGTTALEAGLGLLIGSILGTAAGLLLWTNRTLAQIARPYIIIIGAVPIFSFAPMLIVWFGTGLASKVFMAAFAVFFVSLAQAYEGARAIAAEYLTFARSIGAGYPLILRKILIPGAMRWVRNGFSISVGFALMGAFIGEFVSSEAGLGHYIVRAGSLYDMPRVIFGTALLAALALIFSSLAHFLEVRKGQGARIV